MKKRTTIDISIPIDEVIDILSVKYPEIKEAGLVVTSVHGFRECAGILGPHGGGKSEVQISLVDQESFDLRKEEESKYFKTQEDNQKKITELDAKLDVILAKA